MGIENKVWFEWMHRLRPRKIEEVDWVLVYDSSLDNQHWWKQKFPRRWFRPDVVAGSNANAMYHLSELEGMRMAMLVVEKQIKIFKK